MSVLRAETRAHHDGLESALDLLAQPLSRDRFLHVLARFHGFHQVWDEAIAAHETLRAFHAPRRRAALLRADLLALGLSAREIDDAPICEAVRACAADDSAALGSLYVLEGSTLGGQIITRALATAPWAPAHGLASFHPYGADTGAMWRDFGLFAEQLGATRAHARIVSGAQATFVLLKGWLAT